jgi:hypothetical protein
MNFSGGPLDKEGAIGKNFSADGSVSRTFQELAKNEQRGGSLFCLGLLLVIACKDQNATIYKSHGKETV